MIDVELTLSPEYVLRRTSAGKQGHLNLRSAGKDLRRVRAAVSWTAWKCFDGRLVGRRPAAEIAAELGITANVVYVYASRVLQEVRRRCAEIEEELGDGCDLDLP